MSLSLNSCECVYCNKTVFDLDCKTNNLERLETEVLVKSKFKECFVAKDYRDTCETNERIGKRKNNEF